MEPEEYRRTAQAEGSHFWFRELRWIWESLLDAPGLPSGKRLRILDAGCGTGGNLARLVARHDAVGLDRSPLALGIAATKGGAPLVRATVLEMPIRSDSMDAVLSTDVIYHRDVDDDVAALREMHRVLRPGGRLVVNVPAFDSLRSAHDRAVHTARRYDRRMLHERLEAAGFRSIRAIYWNSILLLPAIVVRLWRRGASGSDISTPASPLNGLLTGVGRIDATLALTGLFPAGLSIAAVGRKPE